MQYAIDIEGSQGVQCAIHATSRLQFCTAIPTTERLFGTATVNHGRPDFEGEGEEGEGRLRPRQQGGLLMEA